MLDLAVGEKSENRLTALNNLIVLARDDAGSSEILAADGVKLLLGIMNSESAVNDDEIRLAITRIFASLCKSSFRRAKLVRLYVLISACLWRKSEIFCQSP